MQKKINIKDYMKFSISYIVVGLVFSVSAFAENTDIVYINNHKVNVLVVSERNEIVKGLSGIEDICESCGMLFELSQAAKWVIWSKGMRFDFDVIFVRDDQILEIIENVSSRYVVFAVPIKPVTEVLEMKAGSSVKFGFRPGQYINRVNK